MQVGLQAWGIWFQLLNIAEENAAMRRRRAIESIQGLEHVSGTFVNAIAQAAQMGWSHQEVQTLLNCMKVTPTITVHPTEAKRVTVLQIHRRIYVILYRLEATRWTPREREALEEQLRNEIDLLWLTGELRLEKPAVVQEIKWGLHFFEQTLEALSSLACTTYRQLVEETGLVDYYQAASPVQELGRLRIGSRPDRRFGAGSPDDLRAIPWVFAWTWNRHHVPA